MKKLIIFLFIVFICFAGNYEYVECNIDPFANNVGDFLDTDRRSIGLSAYNAYEKGDYERAASCYLEYLKTGIEDSGNIYNLACCYGLLGKESLASNFLLKAYHAGFEDIEHIKWDPDFEKIRESQEYKTAIDSIENLNKRKKAPGKIMYFETPVLLQYNIILPDNYDSTMRYDLIVGLHGFGANHKSFSRLWNRIEHHDFIYVAPQAPNSMFGSKDESFSWEASLPEELEDMPNMELSENFIVSLVKELKKTYKPKRVFLTGFSQGAFLTYVTGIHNPELFDGLMPFGGYFFDDLFTEEELKAASKTRIFIGHGNEDRIVEYKSSEIALDKFKEFNFDVELFTFKGDHTIPESLLIAAEEWMNEK